MKPSPMTTIGAYEAKTHLAALLDRVERGERVTITRHGRAVAVLVPPPGVPDLTADEAVEGLLAFRAGHRLGEGLSIRGLIEQGRK